MICCDARCLKFIVRVKASANRFLWKIQWRRLKQSTLTCTFVLSSNSQQQHKKAEDSRRFVGLTRKSWKNVEKCPVTLFAWHRKWSCKQPTFVFSVVSQKKSNTRREENRRLFFTRWGWGFAFMNIYDEIGKHMTTTANSDDTLEAQNRNRRLCWLFHENRRRALKILNFFLQRTMKGIFCCLW